MNVSHVFCAIINIHEAKLLQPITSHQLNAWLLRQIGFNLSGTSSPG